MSNFLPSGQYYIRNEETFAGRNRLEDRSLLPKRVYCPTDSGDAELWILERLDNGRYKLSARGAPTGEIDKLLFAFLIERDKAEEWIITYRKDSGPRTLYTIEKSDRSAGWFRQGDSGDEPSQIAVRPLIATPSIPPQFLPSELWNIQPLVD